MIEARLGRAGAQGKVAALTALLRRQFLVGPTAGGWLDSLDDKGRCVNEYMPASTLYHLLGAIDELSRFAGSSPSC